MALPAVAVAPGFMRTERILAAMHAAHPFDLSWTESPEYLGRCVRALAEDPDVMRRWAKVFTVGRFSPRVWVHGCRRPAAGRVSDAEAKGEGGGRKGEG